MTRRSDRYIDALLFAALDDQGAFIAWRRGADPGMTAAHVEPDYAKVRAFIMDTITTEAVRALLEKENDDA